MPRKPSISKMDARYWKSRLFRNSFSYKGELRHVNGWSVKIQLFGKRKTFSLGSADPGQASAEACYLYQTIQTQGWDSVSQPHSGRGFRGDVRPQTPARDDLSLEYWQKRLVRRKYPEPQKSQAERELSVRIEYGGMSRYFPLATQNETVAARKALRIYQSVRDEGWAVANQKFVRELTLAVRWLDNPLAWTYTTFHTSTGVAAAGRRRQRRGQIKRVGLVESDDGLRSALVSALDQSEGFDCSAAYATPGEAERDRVLKDLDFVAINFALPEEPGAACLSRLQKLKPGLAGVLYSVYEDSDELFKATPGGSIGYLLKRTPVHHLLDPLASIQSRLTPEVVAHRIRGYFHELAAALPPGAAPGENAKLTPRENEILGRLARGAVAKEIADALGISIWTVHGHIKSVFEKLGVHTRTEAVLKFLQK